MLILRCFLPLPPCILSSFSCISLFGSSYLKMPAPSELATSFTIISQVLFKASALSCGSEDILLARYSMMAGTDQQYFSIFWWQSRHWLAFRLLTTCDSSTQSVRMVSGCFCISLLWFCLRNCKYLFFSSCDHCPVLAKTREFPSPNPASPSLFSIADDL